MAGGHVPSLLRSRTPLFLLTGDFLSGAATVTMCASASRWGGCGQVTAVLLALGEVDPLPPVPQLSRGGRAEPGAQDLVFMALSSDVKTWGSSVIQFQEALTPAA